MFMTLDAEGRLLFYPRRPKRSTLLVCIHPLPNPSLIACEHEIEHDADAVVRAFVGGNVVPEPGREHHHSTSTTVLQTKPFSRSGIVSLE
jgi:hypothetical protein